MTDLTPTNIRLFAGMMSAGKEKGMVLKLAEHIELLMGLLREFRDAPDTQKIREWENLVKRCNKAINEAKENNGL